mmetsp:Transcript_15075/g.32627  ORF Transcript_15075/g.32627 Transcript_15075/m.32627 type:complete len:217 (+) Transcript_15075:2320-2970(+)
MVGCCRIGSITVEIGLLQLLRWTFSIKRYHHPQQRHNHYTNNQSPPGPQSPAHSITIHLLSIFVIIIGITICKSRVVTRPCSPMQRVIFRDGCQIYHSIGVVARSGESAQDDGFGLGGGTVAVFRFGRWYLECFGCILWLVPMGGVVGVGILFVVSPSYTRQLHGTLLLLLLMVIVVVFIVGTVATTIVQSQIILNHIHLADEIRIVCYDLVRLLL